MPKPHFRDKNVAVATGVAAFAVGWYCLHDAWEGRGGDQPWWIRWATWW